MYQTINICEGAMGQWVLASFFYAASQTKVTLVSAPTQSDTAKKPTSYVEIEGQVYRVPSAKWRWHRFYWRQRHFSEGTPKLGHLRQAGVTPQLSLIQFFPPISKFYLRRFSHEFNRVFSGIRLDLRFNNQA